MKYRNKSKQVKVQPVFTGKDYEIAQQKFERSFEQFNQSKERLNQQIKQNQQRSDLYRSFSMNGFGVINCDRPIAREGKSVKMDLQYKGNAPKMMYAVLDDRYLLTLPNGKRDIHYNFKQNVNQQLIGVYDDGSVIHASSHDMDVAMSKAFNDELRVKMKSIPEKATEDNFYDRLLNS